MSRMINFSVALALVFAMTGCTVFSDQTGTGIHKSYKRSLGKHS